GLLDGLLTGLGRGALVLGESVAAPLVVLAALQLATADENTGYRIACMEDPYFCWISDDPTIGGGTWEAAFSDNHEAKLSTTLSPAASQLGTSGALAVQGARAAGQLRNVARHLARLLAQSSVGGVPSGEPPKKNDRDDQHWWSEIKASLKEFRQALRG